MPEKQPSHAYMVANPTKDWTSCAIGSSVRKCPQASLQYKYNTLPPTSAAVKNHSARVYYQVQEWMGHRALDPQQLGWTLEEGRLDSTTTNLPAAPESLLKIVCCNCKTDCNSRRCTCRKMGLEWSVVSAEALAAAIRLQWKTRTLMTSTDFLCWKELQRTHIWQCAISCALPNMCSAVYIEKQS